MSVVVHLKKCIDLLFVKPRASSWAYCEIHISKMTVPSQVLRAMEKMTDSQTVVINWDKLQDERYHSRNPRTSLWSSKKHFWEN